ncbi:unnamed protein product [Ophioblennius macclurei]
MPSLPPVRWAFLCSLLLLETQTAHSGDLQCRVPSQAVARPHPVQGLLERFEAGPGCAAREGGAEETHVVALGRVANGAEKQVTVYLKPLAPPPSRLRFVRLLLSSRLPVTWRLQGEELPASLPLQVEVSSDSSVQSHGLNASIHAVGSLPFRPRALHRWALKRHGSLSSMTHAAHGNRVYIRLGEDPTQPAMCQLQSMFLSQNYIISDIQPQEVLGCTQLRPPDRVGPEVHVIKLHSAGSGLCGSLQVEVVVSLLPPAGRSAARRVVLILSSSVPVNWAVAARGVRGHVTVHSSHSVSPPYPPEPGLILSSTMTSDLSTVPDLLLWAGQRGYGKVTSYTETDLANRLLIQLSDTRAGEPASSSALPTPFRVEEHQLRQWMSGDGAEQASRESFTVNCEDGRLSMAVERRLLQTLPVAVATVTLGDPTCQAESNRSHFLLAFPVISCGTESLILRRPRGVLYQNTVLLWREQSRKQMAPTETPLSIQFSCFVPIPNPAHPADPPTETRVGPVIWTHEGQRFRPGLTDLQKPRPKSRPVLLLKLSPSESSKETRVGPCIAAAYRRLHMEISAQAPITGSIRVTSCFVSPLSDPKKSPYWTVISGGCSTDPSLTLSEGSVEEKEEVPSLKFSFILRPVYTESIQFLHCSLNLCAADGDEEEVTKGGVADCRKGLRIPPLASQPHGGQCETRNLSRPLLVTWSVSSPAPQIQTPAGQRRKRLSVNPADGLWPERSVSVLQIGPLMGMVGTAFVLGVGVMGGLWCIRRYTGPRSQNAHFTDQTHLGHDGRSRSAPLGWSSSSV